MKKENKFRVLLWLIQGIIVGFGAIMPGISGGTLCVAFGMYLPIISVLSKPKENLKKHGKKLLVFVLGGVIGFVGLSDFASWLMSINSGLVTCAFIGFIIGTFPELWSDAGIKGRTKLSYVAMTVGFLLMFMLLVFLKTHTQIVIRPNVLGFALCGILWGLSFIVPGLSSSSLLLFFDLYQPMLDGIGRLDMTVIIPVGIGALACVCILSGWINYIYKRYYSTASHAIIGVVVATVIMILPEDIVGVYQVLCIVAGAIVSYMLKKICLRLESND